MPLRQLLDPPCTQPSALNASLKVTMPLLLLLFTHISKLQVPSSGIICLADNNPLTSSADNHHSPAAAYQAAGLRTQWVACLVEDLRTQAGDRIHQVAYQEAGRRKRLVAYFAEDQSLEVRNLADHCSQRRLVEGERVHRLLLGEVGEAFANVAASEVGRRCSLAQGFGRRRMGSAVWRIEGPWLQAQWELLR